MMKRKPKPDVCNPTQGLAEFTKALINAGSFTLSTLDLSKSKDTGIHTTVTIKNVISNMHDYSVSSLGKVNHSHLKDLLPGKLRNDYNKQLYPYGL